jgi:hypothetical protein
VIAIDARSVKTMKERNILWRFQVVEERRR